jgi:hypothetical protein
LARIPAEHTDGQPKNQTDTRGCAHRLERMLYDTTIRLVFEIDESLDVPPG